MPDHTCVLDASALLAPLRDEPGGEEVRSLIAQAAISTVNWTEVVQRSMIPDGEVEESRLILQALGLKILAVSIEDSERAARLYEGTRMFGLSLGDRACIALAERLGVPAMTADREWARIDLPIEVILIR